MTATDPGAELEPRRPALVAWIVFFAVAASLCWPMLQGKFLANPQSDMFLSGYSFRAFGAEYFRRYHAIPLWNPYIFGGLPYVGAAHGDIFYPTAWIRWILPTDTAINLGFFAHIVIAGGAMYGLLRTLRLGWAGAIVGGLAYQLTGIVISLVHPGHDGKLFVSALAPFLLLGIVLAVRDRRLVGYAIIALAAGLALQGHPQTAQYLLVAGAVWGAFWLFGREGPKGADRIRVLAAAVGAVALGVGLYAVYALPMAQYVPHSPRGIGGPNTGWEHAIQFSLPLNELLGTVLPAVYGKVSPTYFGQNTIRLHSEYLGPVGLILATLGIGRTERPVAPRAFATLAILFLLVSLGGSTPFFRVWYAVMPLTGKLRAPGQAFFLVALSLAYFAGQGAERLVRGLVTRRRILIAAGVFVALGLLAAGGGLQFMAEDIARNAGFEGLIEQAIANAPALRADGIRVVVAAIAGGLVLLLVAAARLRGPSAVLAIGLVLFADLWFVGRTYFVFSPGRTVSYADDAITTKLHQTPLPFRVWQPGGQLGGAAAYPGSWLMSRQVPTMFGYHGNELRYFDDVLGGKNAWPNQTNPNVLKLFGVQFLVANQKVEPPGWHEVLGGATTALGTSAYVYAADTAPPYARVLAGAAKVPDGQIGATLADPRFPIDRLVIYPDTAAINPPALGNQMPAPSTRTAAIADWRPGFIRVSIGGVATSPEYLVVSENWYLDWHATIDGRPAPVLRGQGTLLSVELPPGAKEVIFDFQSASYRTGRAISLASAAVVLVLFGWPLVRRERRTDG